MIYTNMHVIRFFEFAEKQINLRIDLEKFCGSSGSVFLNFTPLNVPGYV